MALTQRQGYLQKVGTIGTSGLPMQRTADDSTYARDKTIFSLERGTIDAYGPVAPGALMREKFLVGNTLQIPE